MKKLITIVGIFIALLIANPVSALNINVQVNINTQPAWGPVGYDYVEYYYIPAIDCYYNVNLGVFYYWDRGRWISARYLPARYHHYDLYNMYKVVINEPNPWQYNARHRRAYAQYNRGTYNQVIILNSKDSRYQKSRNNRVDWRASSTSSSRPAANTSTSRVSTTNNSSGRSSSTVSSGNSGRTTTNNTSSSRTNTSPTTTQSSRTSSQSNNRTTVTSSTQDKKTTTNSAQRSSSGSSNSSRTSSSSSSRSR